MAIGENFPLTNIDEHTFERLCVQLCHELLGPGTSAFSAGPDGGVDAKFKGKAKEFPSESAPWEGSIVIQAKHTTEENASCSDSDFISILEKETKKITRLYNRGEIDYYLLFTNRKLSANQSIKIKEIFREVKLKDIWICGIESINALLVRFPYIVDELKLNVWQYPFRFNAEDLKTLINSVANVFHPISSQNDQIFDFSFPGIRKKNKKNNLSLDFFRDNIQRKAYKYFKDIDSFLKSEGNVEERKKYENITFESQGKMHLLKQQYDKFENILVYLFDFIIARKPELTSQRYLVWVFLYYMYCNCDIGTK